MSELSSEPQTGSPDQDSNPKHSSIVTNHSTGASLNQRSCVTCRKRKVKCDKRHPCSNCTRAHIDCIFPAPGRAPRRPRKLPDTELLARLRRLEGVIHSLGVSVGDEHNAEHVQTSIPPHDEVPRIRNVRSAHVHQRSSLDSQFGRLFIEDGKSRYVNNLFWANLNDEVEDLKDTLYDSSEDEDTPSPRYTRQSTPTHQAFMFNFSSLAVDLHSMHPSPSLMPLYWQIYEEHCEPLVKMFHAPTMRKQVIAVASQPGRSTKGMEVMLFAIYFAAVTSLSPEECESRLGEPRAALMSRFRFCLEQGLSKANFLMTEEIIVLQAFVLYVLCLRRHEGSRATWSLCGLVVRIAITLGLHRDGSDFNLPPFEAEIRRRTWWQICMLDVRTSDDHGCDPTIMVHTFDTRKPLNINDDDLSPTMIELPQERTGITDMTFACIRFDITSVFTKLMSANAVQGLKNDTSMALSLAAKEEAMLESQRNLEEKYLRHCDMGVPMQWVIFTVTRIIMAKLWLVVYLSYQKLDGGNSLPQDTKNTLFVTALESIEYALLLETEVHAVKWGWLYKTYYQWHALAFLLTELNSRTHGDLVTRAWRAVDATIVKWGGSITEDKKNNLWKPLRKLMAKARAIRDRQLMIERKIVAADVQHEPLQWTDEHGEALPQGLEAYRLPRSLNSTNAEFTLKKEEDENPTSTTMEILHPPFGSGFAAVNGYQGDTVGFPSEFLPYAEPQHMPGTLESNSGLLQQHDGTTNNEWNLYNEYHSGTVSGGPELNFNGEPSGMNASGVDYAQDSFAMELVDPMIDGEGGPVLQWDTWDDMVREFEQQNGAGSSNQWQARRFMMGDTWL